MGIVLVKVLTEFLDGSRLPFSGVARRFGVNY